MDNIDFEKCKNVEDLFEFYLDKVNLTHLDKESVQYIETKRAFYAGFGTAIVATEAICEVNSEDDAFFSIIQLKDEVNDFWQEEAEK